jgi:hypothetical protein
MDSLTYAIPRPARARVRLKFRLYDDGADGDPTVRRSWSVFAVHWIFFGEGIGYVNAIGPEDALAKAYAKYPEYRRLKVFLNPEQSA